MRRALWRSANEIIIDTSWTARAFQKAAARWSTVVLYLGLPASVATAVTAAGAGTVALVARMPVAVAVLGLTAAVIAGAKAVLRPEDTYQGYNSKGSAYLVLRNDARQFRDIRVRNPRWSDAELESELRSLNGRLNALVQQPPLRVPTWAYQQAKKSIEAGESDYVSDRFWQEPPF